MAALSKIVRGSSDEVLDIEMHPSVPVGAKSLEGRRFKMGLA